MTWCWEGLSQVTGPRSPSACSSGGYTSFDCERVGNTLTERRTGPRTQLFWQMGAIAARMGKHENLLVVFNDQSIIQGSHLLLLT